MTARYHSLGTDGLYLRTTRGAQVLALANQGPLAEGAYATAPELEQAEAQRLVAELALDTADRVGLAVRDLAGLLARDAGTPNPRFTLYRLAAVPVAGEEYTPTLAGATLITAAIERGDLLALWSPTAPTRRASTDYDMATTSGWTTTAPQVLALANYPLDETAAWEFGGSEPPPTPIEPPPVPPPTFVLNDAVQLAVDSGANCTYATSLETDRATLNATGAGTYLRLWANSHGPYTTDGASVSAWHTAYPSLQWTADLAPLYDRTAAGGNGALACPEGGTSALRMQATLGWTVHSGWTVFIVARGDEGQTQQGVLFGAGCPISVPQLEIQSGTSTAGARLTWGGMTATFPAGLSPEHFSLLEAHAATAALFTAWHLAIDGVEQTGDYGTGHDVVPAALLPSVKEPGMPYGLMANEPPTVFCTLRGNINFPNGTYFKGSVAEILCLQTDLPEIRAAVRAYLAAKFAITLPT